MNEVLNNYIILGGKTIAQKQESISNVFDELCEESNLVQFFFKTLSSKRTAKRNELVADGNLGMMS